MQSRAHCSLSSLCSQRTNKVLVRLEVFHYTDEKAEAVEGRPCPGSHGKSWSRTQDPWLWSQGMWPGQWRVVGGGLGEEESQEGLTQHQGCNSH